MSLTITRKAGIAGQFSVTAETDDGRIEFIGSIYGQPGPVVMRLESGVETFVLHPGRFGDEFGEGWVREFCAEHDRRYR